MSTLWSDLTREELAAAAASNAHVLLPLGCTEQHGPHLPVDTDTYQVETLARRGAQTAAEKHGSKVLVLPTIPFGPASEHYGLPGNLSVTNETYIRLISELIQSVTDTGFKRITAIRGCGGHWAVPAALWDLAADFKRADKAITLRVLDTSADWGALAAKHFENPQGGHAATVETALCLAYRPELVRTDKFRAPALNRMDERYRQGGEVFLFADMTDTGALGDPSTATAEGGRAFWEDAINAFADRLAAIDRLDTEMGRMELATNA